ncbi:hypothetical protein CKAN_00765100 [Cinnamomum micranthum f. kanehirae]|uniref:Uncharacterized protein n=1 Tax=Cinnamomum micranthum f. kanehirae TaxID=337451 RepID=A0A3S3NGB6_9MAGN|nr:hypothetical protein CKAN_00765100 [Cinnamomum micranthum f. kanehirae]
MAGAHCLYKALSPVSLDRSRLRSSPSLSLSISSTEEARDRNGVSKKAHDVYIFALLRRFHRSNSSSSLLLLLRTMLLPPLSPHKRCELPQLIAIPLSPPRMENPPTENRPIGRDTLNLSRSVIIYAIDLEDLYSWLPVWCKLLLTQNYDPHMEDQHMAELFKESKPHEYTSMKSLNESKYGFWSAFTRKAKSVLDDNVAQQSETPGKTRHQVLETSRADQLHQTYKSPESYQKRESPKIQKGFGAITSSLNYIGGTIGNALEEGLTIVESKTADIISETRKLHIRRKGSDLDTQNQTKSTTLRQPPQMQTDHETQLKASRDVAMAMAAKAKLLLRELKTVKADLAFAKERCAQLEEENKILRESHEKGDSPEDDDLIRLQLETLLAEKARLAHENSVYARENRFLREIVEYHQLRMQDVVYLDEGIEEVKEVSPIPMMMPVVDALPVPTPPPGTDTYSTPTSKGPIPSLLPSFASSTLSPTYTPTGSIRTKSQGMEVVSPSSSQR